LLAFLSRARAAHHVADAADAVADRARAIRALEAIVSGPLPNAPGEMAPEVREVVADTLARLSDLRSGAGDFTSAERDIERGLALVPTPTYFRGHLYEMRGLLEERRSKHLRAGGDDHGAEAARLRALDALETAMKIQADVIEEGLPKAKEPSHTEP
jgi:hypothetical protein